MTTNKTGVRGAFVGAVVVASAAMAVGIAGCNILGPAAYLAGGLPQKDAEHELSARPTVVYVDDRANVIGKDRVSVNAQAMRLAIADRITQDLMVKKVMPEASMISPRDAFGIVSAKDKHGDLLPIDAIGRAVGAEQVIYVEMDQFTLLPDGVTPRPSSSCRVRVIDVQNQTRLFPDESQTAREIGARLPIVAPDAYRSTSSARKVYELLALHTGEQVAMLFYKHTPNDVGSNLTPQ